MSDEVGKDAELLHATCVAVGAHAVLLTGPPGAGKSDLALRLIMSAWPAAMVAGQPVLVADDQVIVRREGARLIARCPPAIAGRLEVRGIGIVETAWCERAEVRLVAELSREQAVARMPAAESLEILGTTIARTLLQPDEPSAPMKLLLALDRAGGDPDINAKGLAPDAGSRQSLAPDVHLIPLKE